MAVNKKTINSWGPEIVFKNLFSGLTVAVVALPPTLAFGIASGLGAQAGIVTAVVAGVIASALGGSKY